MQFQMEFIHRSVSFCLMYINWNKKAVNCQTELLQGRFVKCKELQSGHISYVYQVLYDNNDNPDVQ